MKKEQIMIHIWNPYQQRSLSGLYYDNSSPHDAQEMYSAKVRRDTAF